MATHGKTASWHWVSFTVFQWVSAADQSPHSPQHDHWLSFLGQDTAFFPRTEKVACATQMPVLYGDIYRQRRGHYVVRFEFIAQPPYQSLPEVA